MDEEAAVLAANAAFYDAFNARDPEAMDAVWARDTEVTCAHPHQSLLRGRDAVMASWEGILGNPNQARIVGAAEWARVIGDTAIVAGREFVAGVPMLVTNVFVREEGTWRMLHHHASSVLDVRG